jgi:hypothetical protein
MMLFYKIDIKEWIYKKYKTSKILFTIILYHTKLIIYIMIMG